MNQIDIDYQNLVRDILENGHKKNDRTGTGTISVFGRTIRHSMKDGFPLLTTKKMAWKTMVTELLWFLRGDTNLKFLVDRNCHIWNGDAYKKYKQYASSLEEPDMNVHIEDLEESKIRVMTEIEFVDAIKTWPEFAKKWGELGPVYGKQWRSCNKHNWIGGDWNPKYDLGNFKVEPIDQIANVIHLLKTDPDSRRMIVNAWNVGELDQMVLPPCHIMFQFYTRELTQKEREDFYWKKYGYDSVNMEGIDLSNIPTRAISLRWDQRSVDVGLGLPFNIASYALLLEIIAKQVNMVPEELIGDLGDCHIYNNHIDGLKEQLDRIPYELPKLDIHPGILDYDLDKLEKDMFIIENYQSHPSIKLPLSN